MKTPTHLLTGLTLFVAGLASLACTPPTTARAADDTWAAVAFSQKTGKYGYSHDYDNEDDARDRALAECKADDAKVVGAIGNGWAALALGHDVDAYGIGLGSSPAVAKSIALKEARKRTKNCYIAVCVYSGD